VERYDVQQSWMCNSVNVRLEGKRFDGIGQSKSVVCRATRCQVEHEDSVELSCLLRVRVK
jgi:hypothetical protein